MTEILEHEITTDGVTVWVNGPVGALGRLGRYGVDVHTNTTEGCLDCFKIELGREKHAWTRFQRSMYIHHGIWVSEIYRPDWSKS